MDLITFKGVFDKELQTLLDYKLKPYKNLEDRDIKTHLNYLKEIFSEGKRIRPYLSYLSYKSVGGQKDQEVIKLFVFLELFHVFCLMQDDVMDRANKRHGIKTINTFIENRFKDNKFIEPNHFGNSNAILVSDFLFSWSNEILLSTKNFENNAIDRVYKIFIKMVDDVIMGQMIDLNMSSKHKITDKEIYQKYLYKTAKYSFIGPLKIGASLEQEKIDSDFYDELGENLGLAFQIQDDLMDIMYDEEQTKKSSFNDIGEHQHTIFTNYVFKNGTKEQKETLNNYFGKKLSDKNKPELRIVFNESGAIKYGEKLISARLNNAKNLLEKQKMEDKYKTIFLKLINLITIRKN